jgi:hypothetical protein
MTFATAWTPPSGRTSTNLGVAAAAARSWGDSSTPAPGRWSAAQPPHGRQPHPARPSPRWWPPACQPAGPPPAQPCLAWCTWRTTLTIPELNPRTTPSINKPLKSANRCMAWPLSAMPVSATAVDLPMAGPNFEPLRDALPLLRGEDLVNDGELRSNHLPHVIDGELVLLEGSVDWCPIEDVLPHRRRELRS